MTERAWTDDELVAAGFCEPADPSFEGRCNFMRWLLASGATEAEIAETSQRGDAYLIGLQLELSSSPPLFRTVDDFASAVGVSSEKIREWWRLNGFRPLEGQDARFSAGDLAMTQMIAVAEQFYAETPSLIPDLLRLNGTLMRQYAEALIEGLGVGLGRLPIEKVRRAEFSDEEAVLVTMLQNLEDFIGPLLRRLFLERFAVSGSSNVTTVGLNEMETTLVFVDIVDFTGLARRVGNGELVALLRSFESLVYDVALTRGGRVVKTLGDGAMLTLPSEDEGVAAALDVVAGHSALPQRRAGVASGTVLVRQGDVFGPVVNLASRLSAIAPPDGVVADHKPRQFSAERLAPVMLKGFDEAVAPFRVLPE